MSIHPADSKSITGSFYPAWGKSKNSEEGSLGIKEKLFKSNYYYLRMSFQAPGKLKERFPAALPKHIIRIKLTLVGKLPNSDVFLKYVTNLHERQHLKSVWLLFSKRSPSWFNKNCWIYWYEVPLLISSPVYQYLKVISILIDHAITNKCGLQQRSCAAIYFILKC